MTITRRTAGLLMTIAVAATTLVSAAGASASPADAKFEAQTRRAGLTPAQVQALQSEVDRQLVVTGGEQVSANKVVVEGQGEVLVAVPGEKYARDLGASGAHVEEDCAVGHFCVYTRPAWTGTKYSLYACTDWPLPNLVGNGSWINNQTGWAQAQFKNRGREVIETTPVPLSGREVQNWTPVWYIKPC